MKKNIPLHTKVSSMIKRFFNLRLFYMLPLLLLMACSDGQNSDQNLPEYLINVYSDSSYLLPITANDTIHIDIGDSIAFYVTTLQYNYEEGDYENTTEEVTAHFDDPFISVKNEQGKFLCHFPAEGIKKMTLLCGQFQRELYFRVTGRKESYYVTETSYAVEGALSVDVKNKILHQLSLYSPQKGDLLILDYESVQSGRFELLPTLTTGPFILSDSMNYTLLGDKMKITFVLASANGNAGEFLIIQDMTKTFRQLYPQEDIEAVVRMAEVRLLSEED